MSTIETYCDRFKSWLLSIPEARRIALGRAFADATRQNGAYVVTGTNTIVPIPAILTPIVLNSSEWRSTSTDAHTIIAAISRLSVHLMKDEQAALRTRLFGGFSTLESRALLATWRQAANLATARVDFLLDTKGQRRALEVNATIPAMHGYSDIMAESFVRTVARERALSPMQADALVDANGRNSDDLLHSLAAHSLRWHTAEKRRNEPLTIAVVARAGDAQQGELDHYARRFTSLGHRAFCATVDRVQLREGRAEIDGIFPDIIYRHVFLRRLDPQCDFAKMCLEPERFHILNPPASHLEVKALLALLSAAGTDEESSAIGLDDDERATIARTVPWTRLLQAGAATGPAGEPIDNFIAWVEAHRDTLVLKRSWDYGGKGVFLGRDFDEPATQQRVRELRHRLDDSVNDVQPRELTTSWKQLIELAEHDRDAWVVQALVPAERIPLYRVEADGPAERALYADLSAFTNLGVEPLPSGGVVRAAENRIVNILGGGGVAPVIRAEVFEQLFA